MFDIHIFIITTINCHGQKNILKSQFLNDFVACSCFPFLKGQEKRAVSYSIFYFLYSVQFCHLKYFKDKRHDLRPVNCTALTPRDPFAK